MGAPGAIRQENELKDISIGKEYLKFILVDVENPKYSLDNH